MGTRYSLGCMSLGSKYLDPQNDRQFLEDNMKSLALAAAISLAATSAFAGSYSAPVMEPVVVEEAASSSSAGGVLVPLIALLIIWAATS